MRNLARLTNAANRIQARKDWDELEKQASAIGLVYVAYGLRPASNAGWRKIDNQIAKLRQAIIEQMAQQKRQGIKDYRKGWYLCAANKSFELCYSDAMRAGWLASFCVDATMCRIGVRS